MPDGVPDRTRKLLGEEVRKLMQQGFVGAIRRSPEPGNGWGNGPAAMVNLAGDLSTKWHWGRSMRSSCWLKKFAPKMGCLTSAIQNAWEILCPGQKERERTSLP